MDPGGSDLESSLPQTENPCLIVEDSQPDSVALEDDPDSSYRALLSRRLSNLQPTSHSPVLELIASPSKGRCTDGDCQTEKSNSVIEADHFPSNLSSAAAEHSQVFEVCSLPKTKRSNQEDMESGADSTTHCAQTEEGVSQFGLLELSESQGLNIEAQNIESGDEDVEVTPANLRLADSQKTANQTGLKSSSRASDSQDERFRRPEVSSSSALVPPRREGRELSVQAILHSQVSESVEDEDEEIMSSQDDLFDGERNGSKVDSTVGEVENQQQQQQDPTCTPAHSLRLLHLSGQGTLVQESLSPQSVDFVAATQDNLSQTPLIVPNSPTGEENEQDFNEPAKDTSGTPNDQAQKGQEEPMDVDPVPKPTVSNIVSQNSPSFALEKSLSLPTQPEFSHDVFVPTPSLESGVCSQGPEALKKKEAPKESPSTILDAEAVKTPAGSQPSQVATCFQLEMDSENSAFDKKTQAFTVDDDSQATQIEEIQGSVREDERDSVAVHHKEKTDKSSMDCGLNKAANLQGISQEPDLKTKEDEECSSQKLSLQSSRGQNGKINDSVAKSQEIQCSSNIVASQQMDEGGLGKELTLSSCSQSKEQAGRPTSTTSIPSQSQSQSQSVIFSHKNPPGEGEQGADSDQRLSQPMSQSHRLDSISNPKDVNEEDEDRMDEGEVQSNSRTEGSGFGLALSQSQIDSPERMEDGGEVAQPAGSKDEESLSVIVLEESERVSQERELVERSPLFRSSSQPVRGSPKEKFEPGRKVTGSQPKSSGQNLQVATRAGASNTQASDGAPSGGSQDLNVANKSLSDSSGDLPFHFTLPREGELMGPAASATPPHVRQLKNTPLHSTPIETSTFRERTEANVTRETTMAASEISVEESGEGEELAAQGGDGKLSLRMKVVTPVEESSSGSEHFSLQKPSLSDEEGSVSKATTVAKAVTSPQSIFTRVREVHRQLQVEEEEKGPSDLSLRPLSQTDLPNSENPDPPPEAVGNGTPEQLLKQTNGTAMHSEPLAEVQSSPANEHEAPSTSGHAPRKSLIGQRAVSQQTSVDLSTTASPLSKRAASQQTSFDASGPHLPSGRGEPVTPTRSQSGPSHRRHVRTIQEVRTTITRIITDVYYEDGREVDRKVVEETEEPVVDRCVMDSDVSPSRTGSSMTSGDLADVSSLSSKAASHFSSSGTSSGGPAPSRITDFVMPPSRGAKTGSPRRGGRQAVGSELTGVWGSPSTAPLSPRGHGRRGRPPSRGPLSRGGRSAQRGGAHGPAMSSSEDEHLARTNARVPSSRFDALNTTSPENSAGSSSFIGLRVMAKWSSNSFFYSGTITQDLGENRFRLLFDDNQECEAQGKDILLCDPIPLEMEVTALTEEEYFNTGIVKAYKRQGAELLYCVEKDGQSTWYSRTAVILTMEQGNRLREQYGLGPYEPSTPQNMASDISLDNLVEGKRRRRGNGTGPGTPNSSSTNSPRTPAKRKLASSTEDERTPAKRGRRGGGARAGLRMAPCDTSGSGAELPSDPNDLLVTHGPLPESTSLFMGFVFMLTASSDNDRKSNQTTSDGEEEYVPTAPYNKQYTERQLVAGGGMILPEFNEEQCKAAYQSLLIADKHCRTQTYLLCVAGGVPCVSQIWVRDCCQEKKLMNYRNYLLPAGVGPEKRIIEWHTRCNPFKALKVLLVSEDRVDLWTSLLTMCGAAKVQQHKISNNSSDVSAEGLDLVVSATPCPAEVLKCAMATNTPVVSLEWLVQCVICGDRLAYDSQPEYHHEYSS